MKTDLYVEVKCAKCKKPVLRIDLFPGKVCIDCHEKTFTMPRSGAEVANAFREAVKR